MGKNQRKILVTGAAGFVGSALVDELLLAGKYQIYGLVSNRSGAAGDFNSKIEVFPADISVYETLQEAEKLSGLDTVVHTAGLAHQFGHTQSEKFWKVNVQGTENICRLAKAVRAGHFILISSVAVYGDYGKSVIHEKFKCRPAGVYAESKREAELKAIDFCDKNGIQLSILRLGTVIGEGDRGNTARLITLIDKNRFIWIGTGNNKKSLIYKQDVAKGILKLIESSSIEYQTGIYNLTDRAVSMSEIVGIISQNLQKKPPRIRIPEGVARMFLAAGKFGFPVSRLKQFARTVEKWLSDDIFSGQKFYEEFGFTPETPLSEALGGQVRFYMEHKK